MDPRTRLLLEAPIARTLLKLGAPNVLVMFAQAAVGLIETYFVIKQHLFCNFRLPDPQGILNGASDQAKDHFGCGFWVAERLVGQVG